MENSFANLPIASVTQLVSLISLGGYIIFTAIMYYHWEAYSTDQAVTRITHISYLATTIPLILTLLVMAYIVY
jgi:hypothetical protein